MRIALLKFADRMVGGIAANLLPGPARREPGAVRRILIIRPGGIGDAVLLVPALLALRRKYPGAQITVLAERRNAAAFSLCPAVDHLLVYDHPSHLVQAVRGGFDVVIDTEQWHRLSAVVARLARAAVSVGFATNDRQRLFAHRIGYSHQQYEADSFFTLLAPLGVTPPATLPVPFLSIPPQATRRAAELVAPLCGKPYAVLFPGASIAERRWGTERFRLVAERLGEAGIAVVVVGGREDAAPGESIVAGACGVNLAGKTTLAESAAVIAGSALLVSGDSGVLHLAVGLGVPTVSLFGPGIQAKWGPKGAGDTVLNRRLPCSPCTRFGTTPACPIQARCLSLITVEEVMAAVAGVLGRPAVTS